VTSGEHYGAVLNLDFDFLPYLDELHARGFNLTRTFSGTYREVPGSFRIRANDLAPGPGHYQSPWARAGDDDGEKFDLDRWDPAYFRRLQRFLAEASRRGIVVELVLFCPLYEENLWEANPMNARNNVNGVGRCLRTEALTLEHPDLVARQVAFVRKVVAELRDFDNLYYEVCNEPYFGGVTRAWQDRIIATIVEAERDFPAQHLIAQNIANGRAKVEDPNPAVSLFNFHYARPPETVALNFGLNKALGDDETGFQGTGDRAYRTEGWDFLIAGGAVYSNLDYSYTPAHEDGTAPVTDPTPGGGGPALRRQLQVLKEFIEGFDFLGMVPDDAVIRGGVPPGATARVLAERGRQYAVYVHGGPRAELALELPAGRYRAEWVDTKTGAVARRADLDHRGGRVVLGSPEYAEDIALRIRAAPGS
ncbi:MAG TPA: hypothetical protein VF590_17260, partial [Isosphaeraceae bacterium]